VSASASTPSRRAAFLDRDGVLIEDRGFVHKLSEAVFLPGAIEALRQLQQAGYLLVVVTNQSGIARGLFTEDDYQRLTHHLRERLAAEGVRLDCVEYCPHLPDAAVERYRLDCSCRKPQPGMIERAGRALSVDLSASILVGDRPSDVEAGRRAGVGRCFLVRTGQPIADRDVPLADGFYADLATCVREAVQAAGDDQAHTG
jgi:D-glycero-D-manno-heptose 1,7-bisphosphate phosphatase